MFNRKFQKANVVVEYALVLTFLSLVFYLVFSDLSGTLFNSILQALNF